METMDRCCSVATDGLQDWSFTKLRRSTEAGKRQVGSYQGGVGKAQYPGVGVRLLDQCYKSQVDGVFRQLLYKTKRGGGVHPAQRPAQDSASASVWQRESERPCSLIWPLPRPLQPCGVT
jgi:hypothetical protein